MLASEASYLDLAAPRPAADAGKGSDAAGEAQATVSVEGEGDAEPAAAGSRPSGAKGPRSELVAISAAGLVETVWTSQEETVFAMAWMGRRLFMATGAEGRLYSVEGVEGTPPAAAPVPPLPPLNVTLDHDFDQRQVVGIAADADAAGADRARRTLAARPPDCRCS